MKFVLLPHVFDESLPHQRQLEMLVEHIQEAEEWGFDGYGIGERHDRPVLSTSPAVIFANAAAVTTRIRFYTTVALLGLHDGLRSFEDYSTLDNLSGGRLELIIGKGGYPVTQQMFGATPDNQWDRLAESYGLFRRLWHEDKVTWSGQYRPPLHEAEGLPRPPRKNLHVWHGSSTSKTSMELAAQYGDPAFSSNATGPIERYAALIDYYREQFEANGHDPKDALVGIGTGGFLVARTSQEALDKYRPVFEARIAVNQKYDGGTIQYASVEDWVEQSSALVGSPQQVIDKIHEQHRHFGHEVFHVHVDGAVLSESDYRQTIELFFDEVAPVIRKELPSRDF